MRTITVGVLALQGSFYEHLDLLRKAAASLSPDNPQKWNFIEVRTALQLETCTALIIPGGESTTISLVATQSQLIEPLRDFVKLHQKPTWGTCAGLILLAESANRTKQGGQELLGGLDVRVNRNHFGRQLESFQGPLHLPFLSQSESAGEANGSPFTGVFIRAPVVEKILPSVETDQAEEEKRDATIVASSGHPGNYRASESMSDHVEVLGRLSGRISHLPTNASSISTEENAGDIVAVRQGNVFGTSFHPELTDDPRVHIWWLRQVEEAVSKSHVAEG